VYAYAVLCIPHSSYTQCSRTLGAVRPTALTGKWVSPCLDSAAKQRLRVSPLALPFTAARAVVSVLDSPIIASPISASTSSHSSSAPAHLVASHFARSTAADTRTAQAPLPTASFHPPRVVFVFASASSVCTCLDAIQHPALGGCSACSGRVSPPFAGRAAARVDLPNLCVLSS
jgi:hypothetical protein